MQKKIKSTRSLKNTQFCLSSRKAKIITAEILKVFRGLEFEPDTEIGQKRVFCKGLVTISFMRVLIVSLLMIFTFIYLTYMSHGEKVPPRKDFSGFPKNIGKWTGREAFFDQRIYDKLGVDDSVLINYRKPDGKEVQLYVGYYQSQREGDLIHSPKHCMPGSGWNITSTSLEEINVPGEKGDRIKAIKLILEKGINKQIVLYWFQSRGRYIASEYSQKIYLVWDAILRNRTDGSFVRLISPVYGDNVKYTTEYIKSFASSIIPVLNEYIPGA